MTSNDVWFVDMVCSLGALKLSVNVEYGTPIAMPWGGLTQCTDHRLLKVTAHTLFNEEQSLGSHSTRTRITVAREELGRVTKVPPLPALSSAPHPITLT